MGFREKIAWVMVVALLVGAGIYFTPLVASGGATLAHPAASASLGIIAVIVLVGLTIIGATLAAITNTRDAQSDMDERDQEIVSKSNHIGSVLLGFAVICCVVLAHMTTGLAWMIPALVAALVASEIVTFGTQIVLYRRG